MNASPDANANRERGCARFEVSVSGLNAVDLIDRTPADCGSVRPVIAGTPTYDRTAQVVRLPIALANRGERPLRAPAILLAPDDSLAVLAPNGLATNRHTADYLRFSAPDSTLVVGGRSSSSWSYSHHVSPDTAIKTINAGSLSAVRWIELFVHPGVHQFRFTLHAEATRTGVPVPITAPDTVPDQLYGNAANVLEGSPYFSLSQHVLRNIISLRFEEGTPQHLRQQVVDLVQGEVVGGQPFRGIEGYYLVRVADDGTGRDMYDAMRMLNEHPSVAAAEPEYLHLPETLLAYAQPVDTDAWAGPWETRSEQANGRNWALEAVSAPLAWGCETGSRNTEVALLDAGYMSVPDINANTTYSQFPNRYEEWYHVKSTHGTVVSSLIAARGNNRIGITGMMWQAGLRQYEISVLHDGRDSARWFRGWQPGRVPVPLEKLTEYRLAEALESNASVINISMALYATLGQAGLARERRIEQVELRARQVAKIIQSAKNKPLIVIGSGNLRQDAFWSTYPVLAALLPDQVLVVGGVSAVGFGFGTQWTDGRAGSSYNSADPLIPYDLVEIAAPAKDVGGLDDGGIQLYDGTSLAAPLVAGAAGLLKSFDPRLTAPEIKRHLIDGARRGGKRVVDAGGTVFVLDAYESLKLAAQRQGAPLCGNRIWTEGGKVYAERSGPSGKQPELLRDMGQNVHEVHALHGGKALGIGGDSLAWGPDGWTSHRPGSTSFYWFPSANASIRSRSGKSHDGKSGAAAYAWVNQGTAYLGILWGAEWLPVVPLRSMQQIKHDECIYKWHRTPPRITSCEGWGVATEGDMILRTTVGHSTRGDSLLVAISYGWTSVSYAPAGWDGDFEISSITVSQESRNADLYWVDLRARTVTKAWSEPAGNVHEIAFSEKDTEVVVRRAQTRFEYTEYGDVRPALMASEYACDLAYRVPTTGMILATPTSTCVESFAGFGP